MEPPGTPNFKKNKKSGHSKKHGKSTPQKVGYLFILTSKVTSPFHTGNVFEITKIRDILKMGPEVSKMSPRAPKITQNHESDDPKSKNRRHKKRRGGISGLPAEHESHDVDSTTHPKSNGSE